MIKVELLTSSKQTYKDVLDLIHQVYANRKREGINFLAADISIEEFCEKTKKSDIFVATENDLLIGTMQITLKGPKDHRYGYIEHIAITPQAQGKGIAGLIWNTIKNHALHNGAEYIISDTATSASSSIKWHHKQGFVTTGMCHYANTNYCSYVFRYQMSSNTVWSNSIFVLFHRIGSTIKTKLLWKKDGTPTKINKIIKSKD